MCLLKNVDPSPCQTTSPPSFLVGAKIGSEQPKENNKTRDEIPPNKNCQCLSPARMPSVLFCTVYFRSLSFIHPQQWLSTPNKPLFHSAPFSAPSPGRVSPPRARRRSCRPPTPHPLRHGAPLTCQGCLVPRHQAHPLGVCQCAPWPPAQTGGWPRCGHQQPGGGGQGQVTSGCCPQSEANIGPKIKTAPTGSPADVTPAIVSRRTTFSLWSLIVRHCLVWLVFPDGPRREAGLPTALVCLVADAQTSPPTSGQPSLPSLPLTLSPNKDCFEWYMIFIQAPSVFVPAPPKKTVIFPSDEFFFVAQKLKFMH